jgi:hypothetical protein
VTDSETRIPAESLITFARTAFERLGLGSADAKMGAKILIDSNLMGLDTHVSRTSTRERDRRFALPRWWMTESGANPSLSTCQPVDTHTVVDKRRLTLGG